MALTRFQSHNGSQEAIKPGSSNAKVPSPDPTTKRKADDVPNLPEKKPRSAFGELSNAINKALLISDKSKGKSKAAIVPVAQKPKLVKVVQKENRPKLKKPRLITLRKPFPPATSSTSVTKSDDASEYETANEESLPSTPQPVNPALASPPRPPADVPDFDRETWDDPYQASQYAWDIFTHYRSREPKFAVSRYLLQQPELNRQMRAILVDWLVEVQESFELNHETLYLAVRLVDLYLDRVTVPKETLQLVGATAFFLACKFDERCPPLVDDFLFICDDAYTRKELLQMEMAILKTVKFDIGAPSSYRFLRRYARCAKVSMETMTLARYILETSLMDYDFVEVRDSVMACGALLLALQMKGLGGWTPTLKYYSGYALEDIFDITHRLNAMLSVRQPENVRTIKNKYSHKVFFEVAKTPLLEELRL